MDEERTKLPVLIVWIEGVLGFMKEIESTFIFR